MQMADSNRGAWDKADIDQCITFSLANMGKHENLLLAACYFWSDALDAFLFGNGPMTPTLVDILMLTGLDISAFDRSFDTVTKTSHRLRTKEVKGWKGYILEQLEQGLLTTENTRLSKTCG